MNESILLKDFKPVSMLQTENRKIVKPKYPVIDAHNHLGKLFGHPWASLPVEKLISHMDELNIEAIIDLDGGFGYDILTAHLKHFKRQAPDRFIHFGGIDFSEMKKGEKSFIAYLNAHLENLAEIGVQGIKIWKNLGLQFKDEKDKLIRVNDPRLNPIWKKAAELSLPVMIHVADPLAFFSELNGNNERYEELCANTDWHFPATRFPLFKDIIEDFYDMVGLNPSTIFIGAHVGCYAENLKRVSEVMNCCPNFYVDISARLAELGRQPYTSRDFFLKHQDRIVFGTDMGMDKMIYRNYFRFLETRDEYFNYDSNPVPSQGRWAIYGIDLPDPVLEKIYNRNIKNLLF